MYRYALAAAGAVILGAAYGLLMLLTR